MADHNPLAAVAHGHTLAEAIVATVREPLVVLDRDLRVITASRSFYRRFAVEPQDTQGRRLYELGDGQWNIPALQIVLEDIIPRHRTVEAYEVEHEFPTIGRRVMLLNARRVFDEDGSTAALLLAIEDVTQRRDADREKDELLRQKEVLLQEMQHRVANSLQIIASILLLKARTVQSEETRLHLRDAPPARHVGGASGLNESIDIGPYLSKLCESLVASMVGERRPVSIRVEATSGKAVSAEAVSLGLDRDGARDQCLEACLPERRGGRNPGQVRRARIWLAPLRCRHWIGGSDQRSAAYWPRYEYRRGPGASTQRRGSQIQWASGPPSPRARESRIALLSWAQRDVARRQNPRSKGPELLFNVGKDRSRESDECSRSSFI